MIASELIARVTVQGAEKAKADLLGVGAASDDAGSKLAKGLAFGAVAAGAAIVGIGIAAVKMAGDFQQQVNRLKTGGGDLTDTFKSLWSGIQKVSDATGVLTKPLSDAMYLVVSSGQRGAQAMSTLQAAAQGAQIEMANVGDVAQILTTIQTNFGLKTHTATQYMDGLVSAVSHGKITLQDLSTAMSPILPMAHELGIHFSDVSAALSDMTNQGVPADRAAQALRFTMQSIIQPTTASRKAMIEWGLDTAKVAETMKTSLPDALQMYITAAKRAGAEGTQPFIDALGSMVGGGSRAGQALWALSQSMGTWRQDIAAVNTALGDTNKNVAGWETAQGNLNIQLDRGKAALETMMQNLGAKLIPVLTPLIERFSSWVGQMSDLMNKTDFSGLASGIKQVANTAGDLMSALGSVANALRFLQPAIIPVTTELLALWAAFKLLSIGGAVSSAISAMTIAGTTMSTTAATVSPLSTAFGVLATSVAGIGVAATAAVAGLVVLDAALVANMIATQQADNATTGSMRQGSAALQKWTNQEIADLEKLKSQGLLKSASDWEGWKQSIAGTLQNIAGVSYDTAQKMAQDIISAAQRMENVTGTTVGHMKSQWQSWLDYLKTGGTKSFDAWVAADNRATEVFLANQAKVRGSADQTHARLLNDNKDASDNAAAASNRATATFLADQAKIRDSAAVTHAKLQLLNEPVKPTVNTSSILNASNAADSLYQRLLRLRGSSQWNAVVTTFYNTVGTPQKGTPFASGTDNFPGGVGLVGERGPELVTLPRGSTITPADKTRALLGGGGTPVQINVNIAGKRVGEVLLPDIVRAIRQATGTRI